MRGCSRTRSSPRATVDSRTAMSWRRGSSGCCCRPDRPRERGRRVGQVTDHRRLIPMAGIRITRVNHVALPISDRRKALPFYRDVLGLKVIPSMVDNPHVIWTELEDGTMVHPVERTAEGQPSTFHVASEVADSAATVRRLEQAG